MLDSKLYSGWVQHRRHHPKAHSFRYAYNPCWLALEEIDQVFAISKLWSKERFNLISFFRKDYINASHSDLYQSLVDMIRVEHQQEYAGKIRLLTQLRSWGASFNPVSFYFCYDASATELQYIIAEINNTPWNERYSYVLKCEANDNDIYKFDFPKSFHVSPFMPMRLNYQWRFSVKPERLSIYMQCQEADKKVFDATVLLHAQPITKRSAFFLPIRVPAQGLLTLLRIYWQASIVWLKRNPVYSHPHKAIDEVKHHD